MPRTAVEGDAKRHPLNMRTTAELRAKLESAATLSGRSLAQEVEYRLEMSLSERNVLIEQLGREAIDLAAAFATAVEIIEESNGGRSWLEDDAVAELVIAVVPKIAKHQRELRRQRSQKLSLEMMFARPGATLDEIADALAFRVSAGAVSHRKIERDRQRRRDEMRAERVANRAQEENRRQGRAVPRVPESIAQAVDKVNDAIARHAHNLKGKPSMKGKGKGERKELSGAEIQGGKAKNRHSKVQ